MGYPQMKRADDTFTKDEPKNYKLRSLHIVFAIKLGCFCTLSTTYIVLGVKR